MGWLTSASEYRVCIWKIKVIVLYDLNAANVGNEVTESIFRRYGVVGKNETWVAINQCI